MAISVGLENRHARRLLDSLSEWGDPRAPRSNESEVVDLWFVDADVLRTYIFARPNNYLSEWSSLFSLEAADAVPPRDAVVEPESKSLTDAIALAVSYFLFGRFRESLTIQGRRLLLTPEHDRELDSLILAVSYESTKEAPEWMESLTARYLRLAGSNDQRDVRLELEKTFDLLLEGSPAGRASRITDLRRRFLSRLVDAPPIFPNDNAGAGFVVPSRGREFDLRVRQLANEAFDLFLDDLIDNNPSVEKYRALKTRAFEFHSPERLMRQYIANELAHGSSASNAARAVPIEHLEVQAKIAARQASDIYAIARLVALGEYLNRDHPQGGRRWRINLLTGSKGQRRLREVWKARSLSVDTLRLVHPLSAMGMDGFAQLDSGTSGGFALRSLKSEGASEIDAKALFEDLRHLLVATSVAHAPIRERWMRRLRIQLNEQMPDNRHQYLRPVRDAIQRDYVVTFDQLNRVSGTSGGSLLVVSLPALALPDADREVSAAQRFVMDLHGDTSGSLMVRAIDLMRPGKRGPPGLSELLRADSTGYSALLCSGLGYLAKGRQYLPLARAVSDTAVAFATLDDRNAADNTYPEGNEAHYFAAFVSRMQVAGSRESRPQAREWKQRHAALVKEAVTRLDAWREHRGSSDMARRPVAKVDTERHPTLAELVGYRYRAEALMGAVFCHLIDLLMPSDDRFDVVHPQQTSNDFQALASEWNGWRRFEPRPHYRADVKFIDAQITAGSIQAWLCSMATQAPDSPSAPESAAALRWLVARTLLTVVPSDHDTSPLIELLVAIVTSRSAGAVPTPSRTEQIRRNAAGIRFAYLDDLRVPFFVRVLEKPHDQILSCAATER